MTVYFIRAGEDGPVKIGYAANVAARLATLQSAHFADLIVIREMPGKSQQEAWLHRYFREYRIRREWFRFCPEMLTIAVPSRLSAYRAVTDALKEAAIELMKQGMTAHHIGKRLNLSRADVHRITLPYVVPFESSAKSAA